MKKQKPRRRQLSKRGVAKLLAQGARDAMQAEREWREANARGWAALANVRFR